MDSTPGMASNARTRRGTGARTRGANMTCTQLTLTQESCCRRVYEVVRSASPAVSTRGGIVSEASPLTPTVLVSCLCHIYVRAFGAHSSINNLPLFASTRSGVFLACMADVMINL